VTDWAEVSGPYSGGNEFGTANIDVDLTEGNILFFVITGENWLDEASSITSDLVDEFVLIEQQWSPVGDGYMVGNGYGKITSSGSSTVSVSVTGGRVGATCWEWSPPSGDIETDSATALGVEIPDTDSYESLAPANTMSSMAIFGGVSGNAFTDSSSGGTYYANGFQTGIGGNQLCLIPDAVGPQTPSFTCGGGNADTAQGFAGLGIPADNMMVNFYFDVLP
jgi:hypothetical protein